MAGDDVKLVARHFEHRAGIERHRSVSFHLSPAQARALHYAPGELEPSKATKVKSVCSAMVKT